MKKIVMLIIASLSLALSVANFSVALYRVMTEGTEEEEYA